MKRFAVCLDAGTPEQDLAFHKFIQNQKLGWFHWISHLWLLIDPSEKLTIADLTDKVGSFYVGVQFVVLEVAPGSGWAGMFNTDKTPDIKKWMNVWDR